MTWLSRLKKISIHPETDATEPTKPMQDVYEGGFVGFVAPLLARVQKNDGSPSAANDTVPWDAADWQAHFNERAAVAEYEGAIPRPQAERQAFRCCVSEWLCRNPATSEPGQCAWCQRGDLPGRAVLPYGDAIHGHTHLHGECWPAWWDNRHHAAVEALAGFGIVGEASR